MPELPTGTVTFLFTDIEGSTRLLDELGAEAYAEALAGHRRIVRDAIARHGGVEVDTQGDAFFVAFPDAKAAVTAAAEAQRDLADHHVRVRMGLHTGTARLADGGYVGGDVHLGARIAAAGHGGQVLLSGATRGLVALDVIELGQHRLKDFDSPLTIYQLGHDRFPPLRTISNTNLPRPVSSFIGREQEVFEIAGLLRNGARLVTLTGPGGTGKSRLAIESAAELVQDFPNGVFWVDLAPLRDPDLVAETIGQTLGVKEDLAAHIGERQVLLVLDNFEQVVDAAPSLVRLLSVCPGLRMLDTSRELLRVSGEVEYAVPPLPSVAAAELFRERSRLPLDETVVELCGRLDNLPLAVELAAARTKVMSPAQILERIGTRLDLLKGGRDADPRQQTLRATITWSYDLLRADEQRLFARLSVFRGGFTLEAGDAVADAGIDALQSLADKSLIRHSGRRFDMLETIREFAIEQLDRVAEMGDVRERHAAYFLSLAKEAEAHLGKDSRDWYPRLEADNDNLRAALDHLQESGQSQSALQLAGTLSAFWESGYLTEGRRRLEGLLRGDDSPTAARAKALDGAAVMARQMGDAKAAIGRAEEARTLYGELADGFGTASASMTLGLALSDLAEFSQARQLFEQSADLFRDIGDEENAMGATHLVGAMDWSLGDRARARVVFERNLARARALANNQIEGLSLGLLALVAIEEGRVRDALSMLVDLMLIDRDRGSGLQTVFDITRVAFALAHAGGSDPEAARLLSAANNIRSEIGGGAPLFLENLIASTIAKLHTNLDEATFNAAWESGKKLTIDDAVTLALEVLRHHA
jgi:predicted ATPase